MPGFFDLPVELRDKIYSLILVKDAPITMQIPQDRSEERQALTVTRTNKQIRFEARSMYYACNHFRFYDDICRQRYLVEINPNNQVELQPRARNYLPRWSMAAGADGLTQVRRLSLETYSGRSPDDPGAWAARVDVDLYNRTIGCVTQTETTHTCPGRIPSTDAIIQRIESVLFGCEK